MIGTRPHKADPFPYYAHLRETGPAHQVTLPNRQTAWLIVRYDDVAAALKDKRLVKDKNNALLPGQLAKQPWMPKFFEPLTRNMLDVDEPHHARLRALVSKAFTPGLIEQMRARIQDLTDRLLDAASRRPRFDLIADYAQPLPTTIIAEMLGAP